MRLLNSTAVALFCILLSQTACAQKYPITVEDLERDNIFGAITYMGIRSMPSGDDYLMQVTDTQIDLFDYATSTNKGTIVDLSKIENCPIEVISDYEVSPLGTHLLIAANDSAIHRNTIAYDYYLYDIKYKTLTPLFEGGKQVAATFSPSGSMIAYFRQNNLYVYKIRYSSTSPVTTDGRENEVINGMPDWVYEEEFVMNKAFEWSPDSKEIAYIRFDESNVPEAQLTYYQGSSKHKEADGRRPSHYTFKTSGVDMKNSVVSVNVFNVENRTTKTMDTGTATDIYIPNIQWTGQPKQLAIVRLNRRQNVLDLLIANSASTVANALITLSEDKYFEEKTASGFRFFADGENLISLNEQDGWRHIWLYGTNGVKKKCLTEGDFDVTEICGIDDATQTVYYQAAKRSPMQREIYAVSLNGKRNQMVSGAEGGTYSAQFSKNFKYYLQDFSNHKTPNVHSICTSQGKTLRTLEENKYVLSAVENTDFAQKEFLEIPLPSGIALNAWVVRPHDFSSSKKYPVMIVQYNGPDVQLVLDKWDVDWEQLLANEGYITYCIDTRGTGARGEDFRKCIFKKLGFEETSDLIDAVKYLSTLSYVDSSRIGIWGWSYGGFMTVSSMCRSNLFKMGISIAAVYDWRLYDSAYTERFMRSTEENRSGYDLISPILNAENLSGRLFLIQGSCDDNVHLQNVMQMTDALIDANKQFDMFIYPNLDHSIIGGNARVHLYNMMLDYVKKNL